VTGVLVEASLRRVLLLSWLVPAWLVAVVATSATPALAAGPCGSSGVLSQSGSTVTCTYTYTGSDQAFATPQGALTLQVRAVGAPGGSARDVAGGVGGTAQAIIRAAPSHLVVEVGGPGGDGTAGAAAGGFNRGGDGGVDAGGGGGGASEVCTPTVNLGCDPGSSSVGQEVFVVAAGGGGAGSTNPSGAGGGGAAGAEGMHGASVGTLLLGGRGGGAGMRNVGGTGGSGGSGGHATAGGTDGGDGQDGSLGGQGGDGGAGASNPFGTPGGGGGGGGVIGGGGGGGGACGGGCSGGGGGGGGSSFGSSTGVAGLGTPPSVTINYEVPTASITAPANGQTYTLGQAVSSSFSCTDVPGGSGIQSCLDQDGRPSGALIDTSTAGPHAFTVTGTNRFGLAGTASVSYTVVKASTSTSLSYSANPAVVTQPVTFTATVTPTPAGGTVAFNDGNVAIAGCDSQSIDTTTGTATCQTSSLAVGTHQITAAYSGDASHEGSTSAPVAEVITGAAQLLSDLRAAVTGVGAGTSLADKVSQAQSYLAANDTAHACSTLGALIKAVDAQSGKRIPPAQAGALIGAAKQIQAVLSCRGR